MSDADNVERASRTESRTWRSRMPWVPIGCLAIVGVTLFGTNRSGKDARIMALGLEKSPVATTPFGATFQSAEAYVFVLTNAGSVEFMITGEVVLDLRKDGSGDFKAVHYHSMIDQGLLRHGETRRIVFPKPHAGQIRVSLTCYPSNLTMIRRAGNQANGLGWHKVAKLIRGFDETEVKSGFVRVSP